MSLTVPQAGVIAGRSADVRVATPDIGDAVAEFGRSIMQREQKLKDERNQLTARRTQLDIARDLGQARQEVEQSSDPDEIDSAWQAKSAEIRARHLGPDENGQPRYDAKTAAELDLSFTELNDRHGLALGNRAIGLRQSQREAAYVDFQADITARAAVADPDTLGAYVDMGAAAIDDRLATGGISPEQAAKEKAALSESIYSARAKQMILDDPDGFLAATQPDDQGGVGPWAAMGSGLADYRISAQREVDRRAAAAAEDAKAEVKLQNTAITKRLTEMTGLFSEGHTVTDEQYLVSPELAENPDPEVQKALAEAKAGQSLRDETPGIQSMTVAQLNAAIDAEMSRPKTQEWETERVTVLRKWRDELEAKADSDYISVARQAGQNPPDLPDFDPENPAAFVDGLAKRIAYDADATSRSRTRTQAIVSQDEKARLKAVLDPKADPGPKIALARSLLAASGDKFDRVAGVLEADPVFTRATRAMAATGNPALAESILRGQQKAQLGSVNLPSEKQMVSIFDQQTGGAFDGSPKMKAELIGAARALYADSASGVNPDGADSIIPFMDDEDAQNLFYTSVQRVLGVSADGGGKLTVGGLQEVNDRPVWLPPGVSARDADQAWEALGHLAGGATRNAGYNYEAGDYSANWDYSGADQRPAAERLAVFYKAGIDKGRVPEFGKDPTRWFPSAFPVKARDPRTGAVAEGDSYELHYLRNGRAYPIPDQYGYPYRFSLKQLLREVAK